MTENSNVPEILENQKKANFIHALITDDLKEGKNNSRVHTRFPPEPNGYLHIGHAKSICLNFGIAEKFGGKCNLRFDDTNPTKEETEYVDSIMEDVRWLGFDWEDRLYYASDYLVNCTILRFNLLRMVKLTLTIKMLKPSVTRKELLLGLVWKVRSETGRLKKISVCFCE
jgi:hypothetical protein